jgi:hypothetical protein
MSKRERTPNMLLHAGAMRRQHDGALSWLPKHRPRQRMIERAGK